MYRIGEFSKMTKLTVKALRYYDEMGLCSPSYVDPETGYRFYTTDQLVPLHRIVSLRQLGLSIREISAILSGQDSQEILRGRRRELQRELATAADQLSRIQFILSEKEEDYLMNYQAILKDLPGCTVYYKQGVVPTFADYGSFILQSAEECRAANPGIQCVEPDYCYVSYLDPEFREKDVAIEYAQAVRAAGVETDTIKFKDIPAVKAVCVFHKGPYDGLRDAYAFAYTWLEKNGYTACGSSRECYIDGVWNKDDPADWLTEIQIPVHSK